MNSGSSSSVKPATADLSGFPIIRLDQIPLVDSNTLTRAVQEIAELTQSLLQGNQSSSGAPPMVHYLRKQSESMRSELTERAARERIQQLLTGATEALHRSSYSAPANSSSSGSSSSTIVIGNGSSNREKTAAVDSKKSVASTAEEVAKAAIKLHSSSFTPLPLPSEINRNNNSSNSSGTGAVLPPRTLNMNLLDVQQATATDAFVSAATAAAMTDKMTSRSTDGSEQRDVKSKPSRRRSAAAAIASTAASTAAVADSDDGSGSDSSAGAHSAPASAHRGHKRQLQQQQQQQSRNESRKSSGISFRKPQQHYLDVFNAKFGTAFVVPALNPRRRAAAVKKEPEPSAEERREKERSERRQAAMQRLVERKEQRQQQQLRRKEEQRQQLQEKLRRDREEQIKQKEEEKEKAAATTKTATAAAAAASTAAATTTATTTATAAALTTAAKTATVATATKPSSRNIAIEKSAQVQTSKLQLQSDRETSAVDAVATSSIGSSLAAIEATAAAAITTASETTATTPASAALVTVPAASDICDNNNNSSSIAVGADSDGDSSSSESVSGGDDDRSVDFPIDDSMLQHAFIMDLDCDFNNFSNAAVDAAVAEEEEEDAVNNSYSATTSAEAATISGTLSSNDATQQQQQQQQRISLVSNEFTPQSELSEHVQAKNLAALSAIRSMKLKRDQMNAASFGNSTGQASATAVATTVAAAIGTHVDQGSEVDEATATAVSTVDRRVKTAPAATVTAAAEDCSNSDDDTIPALAAATTTDLTVATNETPTPATTTNSTTAAAATATKRPLSAVNPATAHKILSSVSSSHLLEFSSGKYCCKFGPDDLPGLAAWKLDNSDQSSSAAVATKSQWALDYSIYSELTSLAATATTAATTAAATQNENHAQLFQRRSALKKSVSLGLLLLLLHCEELLLGTAVVFSDGHLQSLWREHVATFEETAELLALQYGVNTLRDFVTVCGNCHAVCKKIEHLLAESQLTTTTTLATAAATTATLATTATTTTATATRERKKDSEPAASQDKAIAIAAAAAVVESNAVRMIDAAADDFDDDESIVPIYSMPNPTTINTTVAAIAITDTTAIATTTASGNIEQQQQQQRVDATAFTQSAKSEVKLRDLYPNIGHIFPSAYNQMTSAAKLNSDTQGARLLLESMQLQAKVYEEWIAVMSDYSTVFSETRHCHMQQQYHYHSNNNNDSSNNNSINSNSNSGALEQQQHQQRPGSRRNSATAATATATAVSSATYERDEAESNATVYRGGSRSLHFRVKSGARPEVQNIITDVLLNHHHTSSYSSSSSSISNSSSNSSSSSNSGSSNDNNNNDIIRREPLQQQQQQQQWEELPAGLGLGLSWNLLWTWSKPRIKMSNLLIWQRVNHYPDSRQLTRKDFLKKNIARFTNMSGKTAAEFEIMPTTFILPHEYTQFVQHFTAVEASKSALITTTASNNNSNNSSSNSSNNNNNSSSSSSSNNINNNSSNSSSSSSSHCNGTCNYWIMKPVGLSRGRGISVVKDLSEITYAQSSVVQQYIERPLCLHGYKFDLRLYVLVTSFRPLEAFIYREGFARVSTHQYSLKADDLADKFIHLTNSSIQKMNSEGPTKDNPLFPSAAAAVVNSNNSRSNNSNSKSHSNSSSSSGDNGSNNNNINSRGNNNSNSNDSNVISEDGDTGGSKMSLLGNRGLWSRLSAFGLNVAAIWESICLLVVKSLVVVDDKMVNHPCCFELFGYDVLIDADLRPWLIEVNASPSLARMNALDKRVKHALIGDTVSLLDPAPFDRAAVVRVLRRRLNALHKQRPLLNRGDADLEADLKEILGSHVPRQYGQPPQQLGNYQQLCPNTPMHAHVAKLKKRIIKTT